MVQRLHVRTITNDEGTKLLRMVRRSSGSVVTWRRAQMVRLSAQGMEPTAIVEVTFTSADRVELADMAEGEAAEERPERGRRPHPGEQPAHRAVPQQRHVIDGVQMS